MLQQQLLQQQQTASQMDSRYNLSAHPQPHRTLTSPATDINPVTPQPYQISQTQVHSPVARSIEPDNFSGDDHTEWADYLVHFEQCATWNGWSEEQKAKMLSI